jgi:hypothetical protein
MIWHWYALSVTRNLRSITVPETEKMPNKRPFLLLKSVAGRAENARPKAGR